MSRSMITTKAKPMVHRRCGAVILYGHAEGMPTRVDPQPLTPAGALVVLLAQRHTYALTDGELIYRYDYRIRDRRIRGPTLAEHRCGQPIPSQFHDRTEPPPIPEEDDPERIPF